MPLSTLDDDITPFAAGSADDLLNGDSLPYGRWLDMRNAQLAGGSGDDAVEGGTPRGSLPPQAPSAEDGDGLPLGYDPRTDRFTVLSNSTAAPEDQISAGGGDDNLVGGGGDDRIAGAIAKLFPMTQVPGALARDIYNAKSTFGRALTVDGTPTDPGPGRVFHDWWTGAAPQTQEFGPDSRFTKEFVQAPSVRQHLDKALELWRTRPDWDAETSQYSRGAAPFGVSEFLKDADANNTAAHEIGSFNLEGSKHGGQIDWTVKNDMGLHSFGGGRFADKFHIPTLPNAPDGWPLHTVHQTIRFSTDLDGRPVAY